MEFEVKITMASGADASIANMAKWIRDNSYQPYTISEAVTIAKAIAAGETWRPDHSSLKSGYKQNPYFDVIVDKILDDYETVFYAGQENQQRLWELCEKGAKGDAEAAIAFCKAELSGEVSHAPFAGGCA